MAPSSKTLTYLLCSLWVKKGLKNMSPNALHQVLWVIILRALPGAKLFDPWLQSLEAITQTRSALLVPGGGICEVGLTQRSTQSSRLKSRIAGLPWARCFPVNVLTSVLLRPVTVDFLTFYVMLYQMIRIC